MLVENLKRSQCIFKANPGHIITNVLLLFSFLLFYISLVLVCPFIKSYRVKAHIFIMFLG